MDYEQGLELINQGFDKKQKEIILARWIANYEAIGVLYQDFEDEVMNNIQRISNNSDLSSEEILQKVKNILNDYEIK